MPTRGSLAPSCLTTSSTGAGFLWAKSVKATPDLPPR
jgi:hypothetical protein